MRSVLMFVLLLANACAAVAQEGTALKGQRVFVAGHSFHVGIAEPLAEVAALAKIAEHQSMGPLFLGGARAIQIWDIAEEKNTARQALQSGKLNVLTLATTENVPDLGLDHFVDLALKQTPVPRITVQESWLNFDSATGDPDSQGKRPTRWDDGTAENLLQKHAKYFETLEAQVDTLRERAKQPILFTVPSGRALIALREKVRLGEVPGIPTQGELFQDRNGHPRAAANLLNTYCHFAVIYRRSPQGLPVPEMLNDIAEKDREAVNKVLQDVAWKAVVDHRQSGVVVAVP